MARRSKTSLYIVAFIQKLKNRKGFKRAVSLSKREHDALVAAIAGLAHDGKIKNSEFGSLFEDPNEFRALSRLIKERVATVVDKELLANPKLNGNDKRKTLIAKKNEHDQLVRWAIISGDKELFNEVGPEYCKMVEELSCKEK